MAEKLIMTVDNNKGETGDVTILLRPDLAPGHVEQITRLAKEGFYDGLTFTASLTDLWPKAAVRTAPAWAALTSKSKPSLIVIRMSKAPVPWRVLRSPNSASSQFFICLG